jgi:preprotein translocase subunit SecY
MSHGRCGKRKLQRMTRMVNIIIILVENLVIYHFLQDNIAAIITVYSSVIMVLLGDMSLSINAPKKDPWDE